MSNIPVNHVPPQELAAVPPPPDEPPLALRRPALFPAGKPEPGLVPVSVLLHA